LPLTSRLKLVKFQLNFQVFPLKYIFKSTLNPVGGVVVVQWSVS